VFANYLIGLREGLEAGLVVSILIAYLVKVGRRDQLKVVSGGVALAVAISVGFGALLAYTSTTLLADFKSQEIFGGTMSALAVVFVTWMVFWMRKTARGMRSELDGKLSSALQMGAFAVGLTAFLAVAREGLETALFFWSAVQVAGSTTAPIAGFALGILTAVILAWLLYRRSVKLNLAKFFTWTGAGLIVIAAGVLGYAVHDFQEAGVFGGLSTLAFDVSRQISDGSWYGSLLKGVFNFTPETTVLQATAWVVYLVPVSALFFLTGRSSQPSLPARVEPPVSSAL
jgi:high-affinity iron transporter